MTASGWGRVGALCSVVIGWILVVASFGGSLTMVLRQFAEQAYGVVAFTTLAAFAMGGKTGREIERGGLKTALWIGPWSGAAALLAGVAGVVVGNCVAYPAGEVFGAMSSYFLSPLIATALYGALPAGVVGLIYGAVTWLLVRPNSPRRIGA